MLLLSLSDLFIRTFTYVNKFLFNPVILFKFFRSRSHRTLSYNSEFTDFLLIIKGRIINVNAGSDFPALLIVQIPA